jgi:hypothetical protein
MSQYDLDIHYIKGELNDAADALSCHTDTVSTEQICTVIFSIGADNNMHNCIVKEYTLDPWCKS